MSCYYPVEEARELCCSAASALINKLFYAIFVVLFAEVGAVLGAMAGAFVGAKTETGCLRGAMAGAKKGSFLSVNLFKISLRVRSSAYDMATTYFQQLVNAFESTLDDEVNEGLPKDSMAKIPKMRTNEDNVRDSFRHRICCSICLEDITPGETVHSLPYCRHMFHNSCIQRWLVNHKSCPLCRRRFRS